MESEENGNVLILPTPIPVALMNLLTIPILFSLSHKRSYDSVANENQPLSAIISAPFRTKKLIKAGSELALRATI